MKVEYADYTIASIEGRLEWLSDSETKIISDEIQKVRKIVDYSEDYEYKSEYTVSELATLRDHLGVARYELKRQNQNHKEYSDDLRHVEVIVALLKGPYENQKNSDWADLA